MGIKNGITVVIGLDPVGLSCVRFCQKRGQSVAIVDVKEFSSSFNHYLEALKDVPYAFGKQAESFIQKAHRLIITPQVSIKEPMILSAIERGIAYMNDVELFLHEISTPVVAIGGARGRSIVANLLVTMFEKMGKKAIFVDDKQPILEVLEQAKPDIYILSLPVFSLESLHFLKAQVATILNVECRLPKRYDSIDEYMAVEQRIYYRCRNAVFNRQNEETKPRFEPFKKLVSYGTNIPTQGDYGLMYKSEDIFLVKGEKQLLLFEQSYLDKYQKIEYILAALALADILEIDQKIAIETVKQM